MSVLPSRLRQIAVVAAGVVAMAAVTGCHHKKSGVNPASLGPAPATAPAPTATITADPTAIDLGQSVVLNWRTENATSVKIDGIGEVPANGTQTVSPSNSTNFHLTATGDGGSTTADVRVTVRVPVAPTAPGPNGPPTDAPICGWLIASSEKVGWKATTWKSLGSGKPVTASARYVVTRLRVTCGGGSCAPSATVAAADGVTSVPTVSPASNPRISLP